MRQDMRQCGCAVCCRIMPYWIKAAPGGAAPGAPYRAAALEGRPGTARRAYAHDPMIGQAYRQHHGAGQSRHPWRISVQSRMQSLCGDLSPGFSADEDDGGQPRNA